TKWDLRPGDWLALLSGVRSSCTWRSTHAGAGDGQPGGTTDDDRRREPGGRLQAVAVDARGTRGDASRGDGLRAGRAWCQWMHDAAAFEALAVEEQEKVIGRTKATSWLRRYAARSPMSRAR